MKGKWLIAFIPSARSDRRCAAGECRLRIPSSACGLTGHAAVLIGLAYRRDGALLALQD